jgi:uncharacterized protein YceH (UPF0502 family)
MKTTLNPLEARVIGALIEKEITTPDQYPLSLNALTAACNQRSNREPVLNLDEAAVRDTLAGLKSRYLAAEQSGFGSRVVKYRHRLCNEEIGGLQLTQGELAIVCELLLRGPQTPGELRSHGERLHAFGGIEEVEAALKSLAERDEPLVERLPREPGKREARYRHLFGSEPAEAAPAPSEPPQTEFRENRLDALEREVRELRAELEALRLRVDRWDA